MIRENYPSLTNIEQVQLQTIQYDKAIAQLEDAARVELDKLLVIELEEKAILAAKKLKLQRKAECLSVKNLKHTST